MVHDFDGFLDALWRDGFTYRIRSIAEGHEFTIQDPMLKWETVVEERGRLLFPVLMAGHRSFTAFMKRRGAA